MTERARNRTGGIVPVDAVAFWKKKRVRPGFDYAAARAEERDRAFSVAGIAREDVLAALSGSLDRAVSDGTSFERWRKGIRDELRTMGWWGKEGELSPHRLRLIFDTNLRMAHSAGQWERIQRTKDSHPFLLYEVGPSYVHRKEHLAWHGVCLPVDDPWWQTHFPPGGFGCKCHVRSVTRHERDRLERVGIEGAVNDPILDDQGNPTGHRVSSRVPIRTEAPADRMVRWTNPRTGETREVPEGIQPGFDHIPTIRRGRAPGRGLAPTQARPTPAPAAAPAPVAPIPRPAPVVAVPRPAPAVTPPPPASAPPTRPTPASPPRDLARGQVELAPSVRAALDDVVETMTARPMSDPSWGRSTRAAMRRLLQTAHPTIRSTAREVRMSRSDDLEVVPKLAQRAKARGRFSTVTGLIEIDEAVARQAVEGARILRAGGRPFAHHVQALRTFLHEEAHAHGIVTGRSYEEGAPIEETSTDFLARWALREAGLYGDAEILVAGGYADRIPTFARILRGRSPLFAGTDDLEFVRRFVEVTRRVRASNPRLDDPSAFTTTHLEALGVPPGMRASTLADMLRNW